MFHTDWDFLLLTLPEIEDVAVARVFHKVLQYCCARVLVCRTEMFSRMARDSAGRRATTNLVSNGDCSGMENTLRIRQKTRLFVVGRDSEAFAVDHNHAQCFAKAMRWAHRAVVKMVVSRHSEAWERSCDVTRTVALPVHCDCA